MLREEGYRVILANSNPATIMTDPDFADATYVEPLDVEVADQDHRARAPDALLPTLGGQTALNLAMELVEAGVLERDGVELIGADAAAIATAEDREQFKVAMAEIGLGVPASGTAHAIDEAHAVVERIGFPWSSGPRTSWAGGGTGIASTTEEFAAAAATGLEASPISEILIETSIAGWKEYELEVMRDHADNCVVICSIENLDPMGVHTGDSVTVAPAQTLSDVEYQRMRDAAFACMRRVGVETGGSNVQFALNPANGEHGHHRDEPARVSRSSALASKATGFPIAKIAARLAVGYTLDEILNDITGKTPASFEPAIDYVVTKIPRWAFEKFPGTPDVLGTQMQSVGEAMAIGRTFPESLQKGLRSLEHGRLGPQRRSGRGPLRRPRRRRAGPRAAIATPDRPYQLEAALRRGISVDDLYAATKVDPWFLDQILAIVEERAHLTALWAEAAGRAGRRGLAAGQAARLLRSAAGLDPRPASPARPTGAGDRARRARRPLAAGVVPTFKTVDTCAAEFEADTPYHYSSWEDEDEVRPGDRAQDRDPGLGARTASARASSSTTAASTPASPSTPPATRPSWSTATPRRSPPTTTPATASTSSRSPTRTSMNVIEAERPGRRVVVALGGQTPLKLRGQLPRDLVLGTSPDSIDLAEDRERWNGLCARLGIPQPAGGTATELAEAWPWSSGGLPSAHAPVVRARRPGHGDRLRRRPAWLGPWPSWPGSAAWARGRPVRGASGAGRPLPGGRHRGGRGRHPRRHRRGGHRRGDGARGGGRRALGDSACVLPPPTSRPRPSPTSRTTPAPSPTRWTCGA